MKFNNSVRHICLNIAYSFSRNEQILKNLSQVSSQLKMKQTVFDKKNLKSFLNQ